MELELAILQSMVLPQNEKHKLPSSSPPFSVSAILVTSCLRYSDSLYDSIILYFF